MSTVVTIGLDLAKSVFQLQGVNADGDSPGTSWFPISQSCLRA